METLLGLLKSTIVFFLNYFSKKKLDEFSSPTLTRELNKVITDTISDYKKRFPIDNQGEKFPFYQSQRIVIELSKYRVMHSDQYSIEELWTSFNIEPNVIPPTEKDIVTFYEIFTEKIHASTKLKKLEIKQTFDQEIFQISRKMDEMQRSIDVMTGAFHPEMTQQWKNRIDTYVATIKNFKPQTALQLLETLKNDFETGASKPSSKMHAIVEYQMGICLGFLNKPTEAAKAFIQAYVLHPSNNIYKEQAALRYYQIEDHNRSRSVVQEIFVDNEYSAMAWATSLLLSPIGDFKQILSQVPNVVKKDIQFIKILYNRLVPENRHDLIEILLQEKLIPAADQYNSFPLTIDSYSLHVFWMNVTLNEFLQTLQIDYRTREKNISKNLERLNDLIGTFFSKVRGSEIDNDNELLYFLEAYSTYILSGDEIAISKIREAFVKLKQEDHIHLQLVLCANVLQLSGKENLAITLLKDADTDNINCLDLLAFCYLKMEDTDGYIETIQKLISTRNKISKQYLPGYLNIAIQIRTFNRQEDIIASKFIENKEFDSSEDEALVLGITDLLLGKPNQGSKAKLEQLAEKFNTKPYLSLIATSFYFVEEYGLAVSIFRKFINRQEQSRDLLYYIYSLYNTKKDSDELLELLAYCRSNFEFHKDFLKAEFHLRVEILDYNTCIEIATYYLNQIPDDEDMLVNYALALYHEGSDTSNSQLKGLSRRLRDFQYASTINVSNVATILLKKKFFEPALELLYRYAILKENASLKDNYFMACVEVAQDPANTLLQDFEIAVEGTFIKYELDRKTYFTELSKENINNDFHKEFLGKRVHETVVTQRQFTGQEDLIRITRIMNKYLNLHDQILEEVKNDPYSGIRMTQIEFDPTNPQNIIEKLQQIVGKGGTEQKLFLEEQLEKYYGNTLSFSEIVFTALQNEYLGAYFYLAKKQKGIMSIPSIYYRNNIEEGAKFVVDFSSLLIIFQLCSQHSVSIPDKLIIPKYIVDSIQKELEKNRTRINPVMSVSITLTEVTSYFHDKSTTENDISFLENLLGWITLNCEVKASFRFPDFSRAMQLNLDQKPFFDYIINTILVVEDTPNSFLITDDSCYLKSSFLPITRQYSSEMYIKQFIGESHPCLIEFLLNKYSGFTFSAEQLNEEYRKNIAGTDNNYIFCLENINLTKNPQMAIPSIDHIKNISLYLNVISGKQERDITHVFIKLLKNVPIDIRRSVEQMTQLKCFLLGQKLNMILHSYKQACLILDSQI